jgi:hypothetical protein
MRNWAQAVLALTMTIMTANLHAADLDMAACAFPDAPELPDGNTAAEEEMAGASAAVRAYVGDTQSGLDCLSEAEESLGEEISDEQKAELVTTYNARVDEMTALVEGFNEQIRAYKAR